MDSPNSPPLPSYSSSDEEPRQSEISPPPTPPTSDYSESEGNKEEDSWPSEASEFSKGTSDDLYGDPEEDEVTSKRVKLTPDESDEETFEEKTSDSGSEEEDDDEDEE